MGSEGTGQAQEDLEGLAPNMFSFVKACVGPIDQVKRDEMGHQEAQYHSCRTQIYISYRLGSHTFA